MNPGEKPPVEPVTALAHTPAGARAFAVFFIKTIDWGYATTSSTYMRHYYQPSCIECQNTANALDRAKRGGHRIIGDRLEVTSVRSRGLAGSAFDYFVTFDVGASEVVDNKNRFIDAEPKIDGFHELMSIIWRDGWLVKRMDPSR